MRQRTQRAMVGLLALGSIVALTILVAGQFIGPSHVATLRIRPPVPLLPYPLLLAVLGVFGASLAYSVSRLVVAAIRDSGTPSASRPDRWNMLFTALVALAAFALIYVGFAFALSLFEAPEELSTGLPTAEGEGEYQEELDEEALPLEELMFTGDGEEPEDRSPVVLFLLAGLATIAAVAVGLSVHRRYSARPDTDERNDLDRLSEALHRASSKALAEMLDEPDDRQAVIAAYAIVQETFVRHGYPYQSSRTPTEFMEATLGILETKTSNSAGAYDVSRTALLALTELYEVAKFSEHPVGEAERRTAIECMEEIGSTIVPVGAPDHTGGSNEA